MEHRCHATGCETPCKPEYLMCSRHWNMVPAPIQRAVWATYRRGQCDDKSPAENWLRAAAAAIGAVALQEGQPLTERQAIAAFDHGVRHERLDPQRAARRRSGP